MGLVPTAKWPNPAVSDPPPLRMLMLHVLFLLLVRLEFDGWLEGAIFFIMFKAILAYTHCNENPIYVFLFWELRGLSPNFLNRGNRD
jgi:hypothetical protein